jgi:alkanesulfonate monooxygenase SsuD/methylene tetrahydromethanopterin reductase-like flavin-dependent oxidoreductase (luciferase family)
MASLKIGLACSGHQNPAGEALLCECQGFDYYATGEHISFNSPIANSFISLAAAAGATSTIRLMNAIAQVPLYPAALLAKLCASLDVASQGRFSLGVGVAGENPKEFEACGVPVKERGARTNEALALLGRLLTEDNVNFKGRFNTLHDITINPKPLQSRLPVWVSGRSDAAMRRAARYGTGWLPYFYSPEQLASSLEKIAGEREANLPAIEGGISVFGCVHEDRQTAREMLLAKLKQGYRQDFSKLIDKYCFAGTPEDATRDISRFVHAGATTVLVSLFCTDDHAETCRNLFANEVLPALRA